MTEPTPTPEQRAEANAIAWLWVGYRVTSSDNLAQDIAHALAVAEARGAQREQEKWRTVVDEARVHILGMAYLPTGPYLQCRACHRKDGHEVGCLTESTLRRLDELLKS